MKLQKSQRQSRDTIAGDAPDDVRKKRTRKGRGWGPFTGGQLTIVIVAIAAMFAVPTTALAAGGAFSNNSATVPAVKATNSNAKGIGVSGTGKKYGVYSNGPLGVAAGKSLSCAACVGGGALAKSAKTYCSGYPHNKVDWSMPGSAPYQGCWMGGANLANANLTEGNLTNANLGGADLTNANLNSANLTNISLPSATMTSTNFQNANMTGAYMAVANIIDSNFTGANLTGASAFMTTWTNTICPDGSNSDSHGQTCLNY